MLFRQTMIRTQNERFGVADHNVQPMEQAGVGIVGHALMGIAFQSWDIASVPIVADDTAWGKCSLGKLFDRRLPRGCLKNKEG